MTQYVPDNNKKTVVNVCWENNYKSPYKLIDNTEVELCQENNLEQTKRQIIVLLMRQIRPIRLCL